MACRQQGFLRGYLRLCRGRNSSLWPFPVMIITLTISLMSGTGLRSCFPASRCSWWWHLCCTNISKYSSKSRIIETTCALDHTQLIKDPRFANFFLLAASIEISLQQLSFKKGRESGRKSINWEMQFLSHIRVLLQLIDYIIFEPEVRNLRSWD